MALTQRFGFTFFGRGAGGSLQSDGQKYTSADRRAMDRILAALENHDHSGGVRLANPPSGGASAVLQPGEGILPSGSTIYYRYSLIDQYGLETEGSDEFSVATPAQIATPGPPRLEAQSGGSLSAGVHWYALTSHLGGGETPLSTPQVINLTNWLTVRVESDDLPAGSDAVSVWRQGPFDAGFTRLVTVPVPSPSSPPAPLFVDDGSIPSEECPCDPANLPPMMNTTGGQSGALVTVPSAAVEDPLVQRWRLYRSTQSGNFGAESLVAEVVETASELGGPLVNQFLDDGTTLSPGMPLETSQTLTPSVPVGSIGGGEEFGASDLRTIVGAQPDANGDLLFPYGVDADGMPYFDETGAATGQGAVLVMNTTTGAMHLEELP